MKTISPLNLGPINQKIPTFSSVSDLPSASQFGTGVAQVGNNLIVSNGRNKSIIQSEIITDRVSILPENVKISANLDKYAATEIGGGAITVTNTSGRWFENDDDVLTWFPPNSAVVNKNGLYTVDARTNLCTNHNATPDSGLTNVSVTGASALARIDDAAQLNNSGLGNICPRYAVGYTNDTGSSQTITISGAVVASNSVAMQIYASVSGSPCELQLTGGLGKVPLPISAKYLRTRSENITPVGAETMQIVVPAGATIKFVLNQLEQAAGTAGMGCSSPIVTAGASTAMQRVVYSMPAIGTPGLGVGVNDLSIYAEITTYSSFQTGNCQYIVFRPLAGGDNDNKIYITGAGQFKKRVAAANSPSGNGRLVFQQGITQKILMRLSSLTGVDNWVNGGYGMQKDPATTNVGLASDAVIQFGQDSGSGVYQGNFQIKNFKVIDKQLTDSECQTLTSLDEFADVVDMPGRGTVFYGANGRVWALGGTGVSFNTIAYSDDFGDTWLNYATLPTETNSAFLHVSKAGHVFYLASGAPTLRRVSAVDKSDTAVLTFSPGGRAGNVYSWNFTEDNEGNLYTTLYAIEPVSPSGNGNQYVYKCSYANGGASETWVRYDYLVTAFPTLRHIHSIVCSPWDNKIYVTMGDTPAASRKTIVTSNKFGNNFSTAVQAGAGGDITTITGFDTGHDGATGLTFTSEGVVFSTDSSGSANTIYSLKYGDTVVRKVFPLQNPMHLSPLYYIRSISDNEFWATCVDEALSNTQCGYLAKFRKEAGIYSPLTYAKMLSVESLSITGVNYYEIGHNGRGFIPADNPYVFVVMMNPGNNRSVKRIKK